MPIISLHTTIVQHQSITPLLRADDVIQTLGLRVFSFGTLWTRLQWLNDDSRQALASFQFSDRRWEANVILDS
jgi:hypothetical protein